MNLSGEMIVNIWLLIFVSLLFTAYYKINKKDGLKLFEGFFKSGESTIFSNLSKNNVVKKNKYIEEISEDEYKSSLEKLKNALAAEKMAPNVENIYKALEAQKHMFDVKIEIINELKPDSIKFSNKAPHSGHYVTYRKARMNPKMEKLIKDLDLVANVRVQNEDPGIQVKH